MIALSECLGEVRNQIDMKNDAKQPGSDRTASRAERLAAELRANLGKRRAQARARKTSLAEEADAPQAQSVLGNMANPADETED